MWYYWSKTLTSIVQYRSVWLPQDTPGHPRTPLISYFYIKYENISWKNGLDNHYWPKYYSFSNYNRVILVMGRCWNVYSQNVYSQNVYSAKMSTPKMSTVPKCLLPKCLLAGADPEGTFGQEIYNFQGTFGGHLRIPCIFAYNLSRMNANPLLKSCIPHKYFVYLFPYTGNVLFLPLGTYTITFVWYCDAFSRHCVYTVHG